MSIHVKICGLSTPETLDAAIKGGASHVGLVFFTKSPRNVSVDQAAALFSRMPAQVKSVGVFVDADRALIDRIPADIVQLHGHETPEFAASLGRPVWKAISIRTRADLALAARYRGTVDRILYDAKTPDDADLPGGMGVRFDWTLLAGHAHPVPWALSGGLTIDNLAEAVRVTGAPLIDVSSGVESAPGIKDVDKIAAFLKAASHL